MTPGAAAPTVVVEDGLEQEMFVHVARQARRVPLPVFAVAAMTVALAADAAPPWALVSWLAIVAGVVVLRRVMLPRLPTMTQRSVAERLRLAVALSIVSGLSHGAGVAFYPYLGDYERVVQTLLLLALATGAVATTIGHRGMFLGFLVPAVTPLCLAWAIHGLTGRAGWIEVLIAVFIAAFSLILLAMARDGHRLFVESFEMRRQQASMNLQLREALAQAEVANRAKIRFLASASHDLRQPMHTLSLFAEALWMRPLDPASRDIARHLRTALLALGSQLDALLDISKLDAQVVEARPVALDLDQVLRRLHAQYLPEARRRELELLLSSDGEGPCETDPMLLERILRNLIDNALKYTRAGRIELSLETAGGEHLLRVRDTGCGIAPAEQARVFEEFYQVDNAARDRTQGLGLGLSIVERLVRLLGLRIELQSEPGRGTTVTLAVPATASSAAAASEVAPAIAVDGLRVLVIDDEEPVRIGMKTLLEELGCRPTVVATVAEAVDRAGDERPDIVLADFRLRGDDGIAAIRRLRERFAAVPALLLSGDTAPDRLREAQGAGLRMLHKPVALGQLLQAMKEELTAGGSHGRQGAATG